MDVIARGEAAEKQLDAMIRRRHDRRVQSEGERVLEEAWAESERRHETRRREANRWEWVRYFDRMAKSHACLAADYERRAEELCESEATEGAA